MRTRSHSRRPQPLGKAARTDGTGADSPLGHRASGRAAAAVAALQGGCGGSCRGRGVHVLGGHGCWVAAETAQDSRSDGAAEELLKPNTTRRNGPGWSGPGRAGAFIRSSAAKRPKLGSFD